jgi:riboflavin synthase
VESVGNVSEISRPVDGEYHLYLEENSYLKPTLLGESVAVNGCCLTVADKSDGKIRFDLLQETWSRTNFPSLSKGSIVNLELALRANARLGGHFVTGHVDAVGSIRKFENQAADVLLEISAPEIVMRYIIEKGSIAVDGVSLTVAAAGDDFFQIWLIPHTVQATRFQQVQVGTLVNLESDLIGKYVEKLLKR